MLHWYILAVTRTSQYSIYSSKCTVSNYADRAIMNLLETVEAIGSLPKSGTPLGRWLPQAPAGAGTSKARVLVTLHSLVSQ